MVYFSLSLIHGSLGSGIFEGDIDLDRISEVLTTEDMKPLKHEVLRLRSKLSEQIQQEQQGRQDSDAETPGAGVKKKAAGLNQEELEELWELDISLYQPRFPHLIRDLLNSGLLSIIIQRYSPNKRARWTENGLYLVLIAYCAMQLGCNLPSGFLAKLKTNYRRVGLMEDGEEQMRRACEEYVDGKPYEFASMGLIETANMISEGLNSRPKPQAPGLESMTPVEPTTDEPSLKRLKIEPESANPLIVEFELCFSLNRYANCGAAKGYREPQLQRCKGCKDTMYYFEGCQNWHWFRHRSHCLQVQGKDGQSKAGASIQNKVVEKQDNAEALKAAEVT